MLKSKLNMRDLKTYVYIETILAFLIVATTIFQYEALSSLIFYGTFVVLLFALSTLMSGNAKRYYFTMMLMIVLFSMISILLSSLLKSFVPTVDSIKQYMVFLTIIIYLFICMHIEPDKTLIDFILKSNVAFAVTYIFGHYFVATAKLAGNITLNFINPNLTAMWLLMTTLMLGVGFFVIKNTIWRVFFTILLVVNIDILNLTGARNSMIALYVFGILVIYSLISKKKRHGKLIIFIFNILPSVFFVLYLTFINNPVISGFFDFFTTGGKELNTRVEIWNKGVANISGYWLFGNFPHFKGGNMHNSHFVLLTSYGIIVLILVVYYIYKICTHISSEHKGRTNVICMSAFLAVLCTGFGEGVIFSGGMGIFIVICNIILLCKYRYDDTDEVKKKLRRKGKKMKILVTGYSGFIGSNLIKRLKHNYKGIVIYKYNSQSSLYEIDEYTKDCDFVFHFAATHRPKDEKDFGKVNHELTVYILKALERNNNKCPFLYTSSIQAGNGSVYGDSKINAEKAVVEHGKKMGSKTIIYRLTNTFGKGARPNGHSVVATFCHNIQRGIPIEISNREHVMNFYYIEDVIDSFIQSLDAPQESANNNFLMLPDELKYDISLGNLANTLQYFRKCQEDNLSPNLNNELERKLFETYMSYNA